MDRRAFLLTPALAAAQSGGGVSRRRTPGSGAHGDAVEVARRGSGDRTASRFGTGHPRRRAERCDRLDRAALERRIPGQPPLPR